MHQFLALQELQQDENNTALIHVYQKYNSILPKDGLAIYIKALDKIEGLLNDIKTGISKSDRSVEICEKYEKCSEILNTFMHGFSVIHDKDIKDISAVLYRMFGFISEQLDLAFASMKIEYLEGIDSKINNVKEFFLQLSKAIE